MLNDDHEIDHRAMRGALGTICDPGTRSHMRRFHPDLVVSDLSPPDYELEGRHAEAHGTPPFLPRETYRAVFRTAKAKVEIEWGKAAYEKLGSRIQRALLAEEILIICARQSGIADNATLVDIMCAGWSWAIEEAGY
jgi:hypothetical protein